MDLGEEVAKAGLDIGTIQLNFDEPFEWASGFRMPIYNDNRIFLFDSECRKMVDEGLYSMANGLGFSVIAGTSTAGIPWARGLADKFGAPMIYVRDKPKSHGLKNRIEGRGVEEDLDGHYVLLIEDLISTGSSSASAVQAIRDANGICNYCLSIFDYGFDMARDIFAGEIPYEESSKIKLNPRCEIKSLVDYSTLITVAEKTGKITKDQIRMLDEWRKNPFEWGEKHGFPRMER